MAKITTMFVELQVQQERWNRSLWLESPPEGGPSTRVDGQVLMAYGRQPDQGARWHYFPLANVITYSISTGGC